MKTRKSYLIFALVPLLAILTWGAYVVCEHISYALIDYSPLKIESATLSFQAQIEKLQASGKDKDNSFEFVVLGDTRTNFGVAEVVLKRAAEESPDFILHTGDLGSRGRPEDYLSYHIALAKEIPATPIIPVPGNHEEGPSKDFKGFRILFGGERYSFDYDQCRFIGFNNTDKDGVSSKDLEFLRQELTKPAEMKHKFVTFHVPPRYLEESLGSSDYRGFTKNEGEFRQLMSDLKVDAVFCGHVHGFGSRAIDGVRYIISGGGGAPLSEALGSSGMVLNFVRVDVTPSAIKYNVFRFTDKGWVSEEIS